jgi:hypothetical protein
MGRSVKEISSIIIETLADRERDAEGRRRLRAAHLEPLDGRSGERLVAAIGQFLDVATARRIGHSA